MPLWTTSDSPPCPPDAGGRKRVDLRRIVPLVLLINTAIALFLWTIAPWPLLSCLVHSHAVGLSIVVLVWAGHRWAPPKVPGWPLAALAIVLGSVIGEALAGVVAERRPLLALLAMDRRSLVATLSTSALFGLLVTAFFTARARLAEGVARLREEQLHRESAARALAEAELKLLQAQIEPHFLFNTLSNVVQLVEEDPPRARRMLLNLTSYLRGSLRRTRAGATTLGEELDLIRAYLEIQQVRMGDRLAWTIRCPDALRDRPVPPLLVQPLVENALRHGLEPKPGGGAITISAARDGDALVLEVKDDGMGLDPHRPAGLGLANVRERVRAVSGDRGGVTLLPGSPGLCVRITLPIDGVGAAAPPAPAETGREGAA